MTTVAIHQPNYLPWLGYFRKIAKTDVFVFFDNVQMPGGKSFVSRNQILGPQGPLWLTVPVERQGLSQSIAAARIADQFWARKHLRTLDVNYAGTLGHKVVLDALSPILLAGHTLIAELNIALVARIVALLDLTSVKLIRASQMGLSSSGAASIPDILAATSATRYATGQGAGTQRHLDEGDLTAEGIEVEFVSDRFFQYRQRRDGFTERLSIVDAIFNCGPDGARELLFRDT
jgi:hypothetical protein